MKLIFDTETTGLDFEKDEILQFSAIDGYGNVLADYFIKPKRLTSWDEAMAINHITPEMLADKPTFDEYRELIQSLFDRADELISYNGKFDTRMLKAHGIVIRDDIKHYDVMREFAPVYGEVKKDKDTGEDVLNPDGTPVYKWKKLTFCADYFGYEFEAHNSLEDVRATLHCFNKLNESKGKD